MFIRPFIYLTIYAFSSIALCNTEVDRYRTLDRDFFCTSQSLSGLRAYNSTIQNLVENKYGEELTNSIKKLSMDNREFILSVGKIDNSSLASFLASDASIENLDILAKREQSLRKSLSDIEPITTLLLFHLSISERVLSEKIHHLKSVERNLKSIDCKKHLQAVTKGLNRLEKIESKISRVKQFVISSRQKRHALLSLSNHAIQTIVQTRIRAKIGEDIDSLQKNMASTLSIARFREDIWSWWLNVTLNGLAGGLDTHLLKFEEPLRRLRISQAFIDQYINQAMALSVKSNAIQDIILKDLHFFQKEVSDRIRALEEKGWEGQFERQKFLTQKRFEIQDRYHPDCIRAIQEFKNFENSVKELEAFRRAEFLYENMVHTCQILQ